ncbi:hypothetical protein DXG03_002815 [Asterophora parasitica]|uniref:Protein kinase domain-containing protein n=1 Tax=Asterophora parasitica TaxID=117018 RepID=A0A9P7G2H9_9AGAR|nr:hypothetical protein DXG03_002815 [Asterophora parasitica]
MAPTASAAFLPRGAYAHNSSGSDEHHGDDEDEDDSTDVQSLSASICTEYVSVSPAAMFLSAFTSPKVTAPLPDAEGHEVSGYTLGRIVGYGAFSTIRLAHPPSGDEVAVKIVRRSDHFKQGNASLARKRIKREAAVWSEFSHEHILPLFSAVHTSYADYFFTLYCPAGSLFDILKRDGDPALPQDDVGMMFRQVVRGLRYLHEVVSFVHRDIKLENVLVDESGVCRIGDFGMTRKIGEPDAEEDALAQEHDRADPFPVGQASVHRAVSLAISGSKNQPRQSLHQQIARHRNSTSSVHPSVAPVKFQPGSLPYAAPELLLPQAGNLLPQPAQDIWALGVLLYALLMGRLPFADSFEPRLHMKILNGKYGVITPTVTNLNSRHRTSQLGDYEVPPGIGRGAERVLQGCLDRSDTSRWTIAMVDEVAWGIGWGTEGDDVTPADSDEEFQEFQNHARQSREPSSSRCEGTIPEDPECPEWTHEDPRSRASMEAATRRSSSRIKRSLSRAPVMVSSRSSSVHPLLTRSASRHSHCHSRAPSPSVCALNASATSSSSHARSPSSTRSSSHFYDTTPLVISAAPAASLERGRRRQKAAPSSSGGSVPDTPIDDDPCVEALVASPISIGADRSSSRGRPTFSRHRHHHLGADPSSELDILDETADWAASEKYSLHPAEQPPQPFAGRWIPRSHSKPSYVAHQHTKPTSKSKPRLKLDDDDDAAADADNEGTGASFKSSSRMRGFPVEHPDAGAVYGVARPPYAQ